MLNTDFLIYLISSYMLVHAHIDMLVYSLILHIPSNVDSTTPLESTVVSER